jgi:hypothetical protein
MPRYTKLKAHPRKKKGGGQDTHTSTTTSLPFQQNALPDGASSQRDAALANTTAMNKNQQDMIDSHGGRKRRNFKKLTRRLRMRSNKRKITRKHRRTKRKVRSNKRKAMRKRRRTKRKVRSYKRKMSRRRTRRGGGDTGQTVTVPSFSNSGSSVSPVNANSMSQTSNSTNLNANSQATNDCYATGTCKQSGGFRNHYEVFHGSWGKSNTGGSRKKRAGRKSVKWGCMSGGKGSRDYNDTKNRNPNRPDAHGSTGLIERMFD